MKIIYIILVKMLIILMPTLTGIYFTTQKNYIFVMISFLVLILISMPLIVKNTIDNEKTKEKLANIEISISENKKQSQEVGLFNEFLLEKQELRSQGFTEEYLKSLGITPISCHHYTEGANSYIKGQFEKAIENFKEVLKNPIIKQSEYQEVQLNANWYIANCYCYLGDYKEALNYYQELLSITATITERNKRMYAMATSLVAMGFIKSKLSNKDREEAITILTEAYDLFESVDMNFSEPNFNMQSTGEDVTVVYYKALISKYLGNIFYYHKKNPKEALDRYLDALKLFELEEKKRILLILSTKVSISSVYRTLGEKKKAEKHCLDVLQLNQKYENDSDFLKTEKLCLGAGRLVNVGSALAGLNKTQEALEKYEEALELNLKNDRKLGIILCLSKIGNLYIYFLNNKEIAKQKYLKALDYAVQLNDENLINSLKNKIDIL